MLSTLELLRTIVRQQSSGIGSQVSNLVGPTSRSVLPITSTMDSTWRVLQLPGTTLPTLDAFYELYASQQQRTAMEVSAVNGILSVTSGDTTIYAIRGLLQVSASLSYLLAISTGSTQSNFAVYLDGTLIRTGSGDREFQLSLQSGSRLLEILVVAKTVALQLPNVPVLPVQDVLAVPTWTKVVVGYADVQASTSTVDLYWSSDVRAGGWIILRRERNTIGTIVYATEAGQNGVFGCEIYGDVASLVSPGTTLYSGSDAVGVVMNSEYDSTSSRTYDSVVYTGLTNVQLRLMSGRTETSSSWIGTECSAGAFQEVHRMQRTLPSPTVSWQDTGVAVGVPYEYALQAYGLFDASILSPWSQIWYVVAGDVTPPKSIVITGGVPTVLNSKITVAFTTPTDSDYAGVRTVFSEVVQTGTVASATATTVTLNATPAANPAGQYLEITGGLGVGQRMPVLSSAGAVMTTNTWDITLNNTSVYELRSFTDIVTDYGVPNSTDQFTFAVPRTTGGAIRYGRFHFLTFDLVGNIQGYYDSVTWTYDGSTDNAFAENQPPVVGIRQLTSDEQITYQPDTLNYAVIELSASDPVDGTTGVTLQYRMRDAEAGTSSGSNSATNLNDTTKTWVGNAWYNYLVRIVSGTGAGQERTVTYTYPTRVDITPAWTTIPDATSKYEIAWRVGLLATDSNLVLDNPYGSRGRLVSVIRDSADNWIQVRALDAKGLASDIMTYTPDFDPTPEFSNIIARKDELNNRVYVTGSVDDDTRSVHWWVTPAVAGEPSTSASPGVINNLDTTKNFSFSFELYDGQRRILNMTPFSGLSGLGIEGLDVTHDVYRTPRTTAVFENRRPEGGMTAQYAQATFYVSPPIMDATSPRSVTSATLTTLVDTSLSWNYVDGIGQWDEIPSEYQDYYVRISAGPGAGQVRKIVRSDATHLTITPDWTTIPTNNSVYVIQRGATMYRVLTPTSTANLFTNPNLTTDATGWSVNVATGVRDTSITKTGGVASYKVTTTNASGCGGLWASARVAATVGQSYDFESWAYAPAGAVGKTVNLVVHWWNGTSYFSTPVGPTVPLVLGWQLLTYTAVAPATTTQVLCACYTTAAQGVFDFYLVGGSIKPTAATSNDPFIATVDPVYVQRVDSERAIEYYSSITGVPPEPAHRSLIDQDDIAQISAWSAKEISANNIEVKLELWDDDVKRWQVFARKGNWPTVSSGTPAVTDPLDPDYRRSDLSITTATYVRMNLSTSVTGGVPDWYIIVSPLNSLGEAGPRMSTTLEVKGTVDTAPLLSAFYVDTKDGGGNIYNKINWSHNSVLETPQTTYTVKAYAYRQDLGSGTQVEITSGLTRYPAVDVDAGADYVNSNDTATSNGLGSILHQVTGFTRGGSTSVTWVYKVELRQGATILQTQTINYTANYTPITPTVSAAAASIINSGACLA